MKDTYVYKIGDNLYVNLTNQCSNACEFCVRNTHDNYEEYYLWLHHEPTAQEVIAAFPDDFTGVHEVVFCGYGEPLYRLDTIIEVATWLKARGITTRINTNGQARLIAGDDVVERIKGCIDKLSISLNATDSAEYQRICNCCFGEDGYQAMLDFADEASAAGIDVAFSIISTLPDDEKDKAAAIAKAHGGRLKIRQLIV